MTHRLLFPHIFLHHPLYPLVLCAHVLACANGRDCFGEGSRLVGVGNHTMSNGFGSFAFAGFRELEGVTIWTLLVEGRE